MNRHGNDGNDWYYRSKQILSEQIHADKFGADSLTLDYID